MLWAVRRSVSAVRQHSVNTNRYNTQHTSYTSCVSLKHTANKQTPCSTVLLEKSTTPQSVSKYGTGRFIAVCTTAQHLSLSWTRRIQPYLRPTIYLTSILILSSHLPLSPSSNASTYYLTTILYHFHCQSVARLGSQEIVVAIIWRRRKQEEWVVR